MSNDTALENNEVQTTAVSEKIADKRLVFGTRISENDKSLEIVTEAAGFNRDNLEIVVEENELRISNKAEEAEGKGRNVIMKEFTEGEYHRLFRLSDKIDADQISAEVKDGVLRVHLPKTVPAQKRRIEVKAL